MPLPIKEFARLVKSMAGASDNQILQAARHFGGEAVEQAAPVVKRGVREILNGTEDWGIVSAFNPGRVLTAEENAARHSSLLSRLTERGLEPIEQRGVYGGTDELSFLVPGLGVDDLKTLGREFEQEAVISSRGWHRLADDAEFPRTSLDFDQSADDYYSELVDPSSGQKLKYQFGFPDEAFQKVAPVEPSAGQTEHTFVSQTVEASPPPHSSANDLMRQESQRDLAQRHPTIVEKLHGAPNTPPGMSAADPTQGARPDIEQATASPFGNEFQIVDRAPAIIRLDTKLVKGLGSLAKGLRKTGEPGVYELHPQIKDRVAQLFELGKRIKNGNWEGVNEELIAAFGGNQEQAHRWGQLWGATSPNTDVAQNTMESVSANIFNLERPGRLMTVAQGQNLKPRKITMAPTKVPNINLAIQGERLGAPKIDRMGRFMTGEQGALPIDIHTIWAIGGKQSKFDAEMPALREKFTRVERLPARGSLSAEDLYSRVEGALRSHLEDIEPGLPVNPTFAKFWEGAREAKGLKPTPGPLDILRRQGLLEEGAMLDPAKLKAALKKGGWTAGAIAATVRAISEEQRLNAPSHRSSSSKAQGAADMNARVKHPDAA